MNIQYVSDLHINDWPNDTPFETFVIPVAPILVVAGDVCSAYDSRYFQFFHWASTMWSLVIAIAGNHEYFNEHGETHTIDETDTYIRKLFDNLQNTIYLQNGESYVIPHTNIRFVGSTLWSSVKPSIWDDVMHKKGDYKVIYIKKPFKRSFHPADQNALHALHVTQLYSSLVPRFPHEKIIVVTHHMPSYALLESKYANHPWKSCYASDDDDLFVPNVYYWICGHGHRNAHIQIPHGPTLLMNARGYNRHSEIKRTNDVYNPRAKFKIAIT